MSNTDTIRHAKSIHRVMSGENRNIRDFTGDRKEFKFLVQSMGPDTLVFVKYHAPWCGPCKACDQTVREAFDEIDDPKLLLYINVDESSVPGAYRIRQLPTIQSFRGGVPQNILVSAIPSKIREFFRAEAAKK
jgi:thioredoxin 1